MNNRRNKFLSIFALVTLLSFTFVSTVYAFDGRNGNKVVIASDEVINDDLYVTAQEFILDGTVNGDLIVLGQTATINGTVNGDLMAAGQTLVIHGTVTGAIRAAGAVLLVDGNASIGGDILVAGASLEIQNGAKVGQDLVFTGNQILLAGDVSRNANIAGSAFELRGTVGGNVEANVGEASPNGSSPVMFMQPSPVGVPTLKLGLTIDPSAKIEGDLNYTQSKRLNFPEGVIAGKVNRMKPSTHEMATREQTPADQVLTWGLGLLRTSFTIVLIGLFLLWLFPIFMEGTSGKLQKAALPSLGWGMLMYMGFALAIILALAVIVLGSILLVTLTLGELAGMFIGLGALTILTVIVGSILVTMFVAKIVFGQTLGKWILTRLKSPLAEHWFWPMIIGVLITVLVIELLSFPLIPGFLGGLLNFVVVLFGVGALWLWARERMAGKHAVQP